MIWMPLRKGKSTKTSDPSRVRLLLGVDWDYIAVEVVLPARDRAISPTSSCKWYLKQLRAHGIHRIGALNN